MTRFLILAALLLAACDKPTGGAPSASGAWELGPVIKGQTRSPRSVMTAHPDGILAVHIPHGHPVGDNRGELSALIFNHGPLTGKSRITARFRVEGEEGARIIPSQPAYAYVNGMATLFFQQRGDNWSASGKYETYRWYATFATVHLEVGNEYTVSVDLNDPRWSATLHSTAQSNPAGFHAAIANTQSVGFVFGGGDGYAHGLYATGPARFVLTGFAVE